MNRKLNIIVLFLSGLVFNACQKNSDIFVPDAGQLNGPDTSWYSVITPSMPVSQLKNSLYIATYTDSIQVNSNTAYITTPFGLQCGFPPNCCVGNVGQTITGNVNVELMLVKRKGDMIRLGKPTTSNGRLLVNGGEIFIRMKKENQELQLAPNVKLLLRYNDIPLSTQMRFFTGDESNPDNFNWQPNTDLMNNTISITTQNYEIQTNHLKWLGTNYYFDTVGSPHVTVTASLASNFTNANTVAYTVFRDYRSVAGMTANQSNRKFTTIGLPIGKAVTVIVISKQGNDYFMGYENTVTATPTSGTNTQTVSVKPVIRSLSDIIAFLNTL